MSQRIIDFHVHIYPDNLAAQALRHMLFTPERAEAAHGSGDGTADGTRRYLESCGVSRACIMNIATRPTQQKKINDWASTLDHDFFTPFGAVHPHAPDVQEELYRIKEMGLAGIKLHPGYQNFDVRSEGFFTVCETARRLGLIVLLHSGNNREKPKIIQGHPRDVMEVYKSLPSLKLVIAHYGCQRRWDLAEEYVVGQHVYIDISHTAGFLTKERAERLICRHDPDKILFGSDCPLQKTGAAIQFLKSLNIGDELKDKILQINASHLLATI